jgi:hypothetical protein
MPIWQNATSYCAKVEQSWHAISNRTGMSTVNLFSGSDKKGRNGPPMDRTVLSVMAIIFALTGCVPAPESSSNVTRNPAVPAGNPDLLHFVQESGKPEITAEKIGSDIAGRVVQVSTASV